MSRFALPSALDRFEHLAASWRDTGPCLFLDFDGTLAPIVPRPELAELAPPVRDLLGRLAARCPVCVVSGRTMPDLRARIALDQVYYAAEHGFEIRGPAGSALEFCAAEAPDSSISEIASSLARQLSTVPGVFLEQKRFSVAVHYRQAPEGLQPQVGRVVQQAMHLHPGLTLRGGKKVYELRPAVDWHKGRAFLWLLQRWEELYGARHPLCVGDDLTDEDMFEAVEGLGTAIVVGRPGRHTKARYYLRDPVQVGLFLARLADHLGAH